MRPQPKMASSRIVDLQLMKSEFLMNYRTYIATLVFVMMGAGAQQLAAQNFAAPYLQRPTSAAGAAFGRAYTAVASDASAAYWNPAGLTGITSYSFTGMYSTGMAFDREFNAASVGYTLENIGTFAASFTMSGVSDIDTYDVEDNFLGTENNQNLVFGLSYAYPITQNFAVGVTGKYISSDLIVITDTGYGLDVGARFNQDMVSAGVIIQNVIGELGPDELPMAMRIGFAIQPIDGLTAAVDLEMDDLEVKEANNYINIGLGYDIPVTENIVVGLKSGLHDSNIAAGGKLGFKTGAIGATIDYAYVNEPNIFGASHRIGITVYGF